MTTGASPVLEVDHVSKTFRLHHERANSLKQRLTGGGRNRFEEFLALDDVSFEVREGEVFGVIGHNGSGKSTLLKCMAGILRPNRGAVRVHRRMSALLELGAGFHPELSGRDNVFLNASILGMSRRDIAARFDQIVEFSGLAQFIDTPVKVYSSGMYVRLAFAVAINVDPEVLVIDEILAVGDVSFQQRCLDKFVQFRDEGRTIVLVTHAMDTVTTMCDRAVWLTRGVVTAEGTPAELVDRYVDSMLDGARDGDDVQRSGSGEVRVERVEVRSAASGGGGILRTGDDVVVRIHWRSDQPVLRPVVGIEVRHESGVVLSSPCTRDVGLVPESFSGSGTVEVRLTDLAFLPGAYSLDTTVTDFDRSHLYDRVAPAVRFDVVGGRSVETGGLVTLRPEWSIR